MGRFTLRLYLAGPLQSWGTSSRFEVRHTDQWPSKSGVVGLVAAALGRPRTESVEDLAALKFGVRVVREGTVARDYQTVGAGSAGVAVASGGTGRGIVTERFYLEDAAFVVGLEGADRAFLESLHSAVLEPHWPLALGRRACPPACPIADQDALVDQELQAGLVAAWGLVERDHREDPDPWFSGGAESATHGTQLLLEDPTGDLEVFDQPIGAAFAARTFAPRRVRWVAEEVSAIWLS